MCAWCSMIISRSTAAVSPSITWISNPTTPFFCGTTPTTLKACNSRGGTNVALGSYLLHYLDHRGRLWIHRRGRRIRCDRQGPFLFSHRALCDFSDCRSHGRPGDYPDLRRGYGTQTSGYPLFLLDPLSA